MQNICLGEWVDRWWIACSQYINYMSMSNIMQQGQWKPENPDAQLTGKVPRTGTIVRVQLAVGTSVSPSQSKSNHVALSALKSYKCLIVKTTITPGHHQRQEQQLVYQITWKYFTNAPQTFNALIWHMSGSRGLLREFWGLLLSLSMQRWMDGMDRDRGAGF